MKIAVKRGASVEDLLAKIHNPSSLLDQIGKILVASTQSRIKDTKVSPDGTAFAPWAPGTAKARAKRGTTAGGVLFERGTLYRSIEHQVQGRQVIVGANTIAPYALYLQVGTNRMPARPFVGISDNDLGLIRKALQQFVQKP
jgi:phage virion morphogenesis protein